MISMKKTLGLCCLAAILIALMTGCNDQLRQFIIPIPQPGGDNSALSHAIVLSANPAPGAVGSDLHIDVAGDTVAGVVNTGPNPQIMVKSNSRLFVLNGDNTIFSYIALLPLGNTLQIITEPSGVTGAIGGGFSSTGNVYVTNRGSGNASLIAGGTSAITSLIGVGSNPVAVAGNAKNSKIYVVNNGSGTVTPISTFDNTALPAIPVGTNPIWAVMSADGIHVFVVNQGSNNVSVIDTLLDIVIATVPVGTSPNYAVYDSKLKRVYVSNSGSANISVIDASRIDLAAVPQSLPTNIANITVSGTPTSVAALADGTRVYAALGNCPAGTNHTNIVAAVLAHSCTGNSVSVIDVASLKEKKVIPIGGTGTVSIDAASNSSRVYVVSADAGSVSIIKTVTDTVTSTIPAPQQSLGCVNPAACPQNVPQVPFQVLVFP